MAGQTPDVVLDIQIISIFDDDEAQNWATQWPGVLLFSTWWNGLLYYDDIDTKVTAKLVKNGQMAEVKSHDQYYIHYASNVRGVFAGSIVGWLLLTIPSFICAAIPTDWDDNMKADTVIKIREEYGRIIAQKIIESLKKEKLLAQSESRTAAGSEEFQAKAIFEQSKPLLVIDPAKSAFPDTYDLRSRQ